MSFGYSVGDGIALVQLAWGAVEGVRKACGEHDDLTKEVRSYHSILSHVQTVMSKLDSSLSRSSDSRLNGLRTHMAGCKSHLRRLRLIIDKYNALSDRERSVKRLWQKVQFGNGEVQNVAAIRQKIMAYASAMSMTAQLISLGSRGRMEQRLREQGGELQGISQSINLILARLAPESTGGSVMTSYADDGKAFWRSLQRELVQGGYKSSVLKDHKDLIKSYVEELGSRGILDEKDTFAQPISQSPELDETLETNDRITSTAKTHASTTFLDESSGKIGIRFGCNWKSMGVLCTARHPRVETPRSCRRPFALGEKTDEKI